MLSLETDGGSIIPLKMTIQNVLKGEDLTIRFKSKKKRERKGTYPMAPLGGELLESGIACSSGGSIKNKLEILMLEKHFDISI